MTVKSEPPSCSSKRTALLCLLATFAAVYIILSNVEYVLMVSSNAATCVLSKDNNSPPKSTKIPNVVLMGQFNYAINLDAVKFWYQNWKTVFEHVQVRGPFNDTECEALRASGVEVYHGDKDRGHVSPMANLALTLRQHLNDSSIEGVLYLHDDALLNLTEMVDPKTNKFLADSIIMTHGPFHQFKTPDEARRYSYEIQPDGKYTNALGVVTNDWKTLGLTPWVYYEKFCFPQLSRLARDTDSDIYKLDNGNLQIPSYGQSDFLFVPTKLAPEFLGAVDLVVKHNVFLECGLPAAVSFASHHLKINVDANVKELKLCTSWNYNNVRGKPKMIDACHRRTGPNGTVPHFGMYHPIKISVFGQDQWKMYFEKFVANPIQIYPSPNTTSVNATTRLTVG